MAVMLIVAMGRLGLLCIPATASLTEASLWATVLPPLTVVIAIASVWLCLASEPSATVRKSRLAPADAALISRGETRRLRLPCRRHGDGGDLIGADKSRLHPVNCLPRRDGSPVGQRTCRAYQGDDDAESQMLRL